MNLPTNTSEKSIELLLNCSKGVFRIGPCFRCHTTKFEVD
ncbi:hypothetical protein BVRB_3g070010 [Beta vulgaris subsp. vulgaris]|nr:hypothetical protein BVRB_3g070010 [Beta vulgaris subsp. vulgaris]